MHPQGHGVLEHTLMNKWLTFARKLTQVGTGKVDMACYKVLMKADIHESEMLLASNLKCVQLHNAG